MLHPPFLMALRAQHSTANTVKQIRYIGVRLAPCEPSHKSATGCCTGMQLKAKLSATCKCRYRCCLGGADDSMSACEAACSCCVTPYSLQHLKSKREDTSRMLCNSCCRPSSELLECCKDCATVSNPVVGSCASHNPRWGLGMTL